MKHLNTVLNVLKGVALLLTMFLQIPSQAQEADLSPMDSVEFSLLTCQPHDEVYSLYGHTAIRYHDWRGEGLDVAFNYGVFDFRTPHFALRFVFGLTDYELGAYPFELFCEEYRRFGSMVTEQVINLTREEKVRLRYALIDNLRPENSTYRYNYFYNNCTTKARDIIEQCISGNIEYTERKDYTPSYRDMVHSMTHNYPWSQFGNDLLLGIKSDMKTQRRQQEFLPDNLMYDFDHAKIVVNGQSRPLVKERRIAVPAGVQIIKSEFPLSPLTCWLILLFIGVIVAVVEWKKKCCYRLWDILLMVMTGCLGIMLFLMLFSQHPTVSLNLQFILFNPLPWFFLWPVAKGRKTRYWRITAILCLLFLAGSLFQCYASGVWCLALCLLLQCCIHLKFRK